MANESFLSQFEIRRDQQRPIAVLVGLVLLLIAVYWNTLRTISTVWNTPAYSHGWLVPVFAIVLLWMRREPIQDASPQARWMGVGLLGFGLAIRMVGGYFAYPYIEMISLLPCVFAIFLIVGGWPLLRWSGPALGFLIFMYPLPGAVERGMLDPLQRVATICSTYALQTLGVAAHRSGNHIILGELRLGVVDACSGLRMSTIFLALAVAITLVTMRPWWERITIILSAVPIALLVNVIRITVTGILHRTVGTQIADAVFHDLAGWIMMPMAMGFLFLELQLLQHLFIEDEDKGPVMVGPMSRAGMAHPGSVIR
jgi:exosortase